MADFPNSLTEITGTSKLKSATSQVLGANDIQTLLLDDFDRRMRAAVHMFYPEPITFGTTALPLAEANPVGALYTLSLSDAANKGHGSWDGHVLTVDRTGNPWLEWADAQYGLYDCPYKRTAAQKYYIGSRYETYPAGPAQVYGGVLAFKSYEHALGFSGEPNTVTDNGDGTVSMNLNDVAAFNQHVGGGAWASHAAYGRRVIVWKTDPAKAGTADAVWSGVALSDGANVTVDIPHTFGQSAASVTAADYTVLVVGLVIAPDTYSLSTEGFWILGSVTDGVVDTSEQTLGSNPANLALNLQQLAKDLYLDPAWSLDDDGNANMIDPAAAGSVGPLQGRVIRLGERWDILLGSTADDSVSLGRGVACWLGPRQDCLDAVDPGNVTVADGGTTWDITFPAGMFGTATQEYWLKSDGRIATKYATGGNTINFGKALANATYYVGVDVEEVETANALGNGAETEASLTAGILAGPPDYDTAKFYIYKFVYDGTSGSIDGGAAAGADLWGARGLWRGGMGLDPTGTDAEGRTPLAANLLFRGSAAGTGNALFSGPRSHGELVQLDNGSDVNTTRLAHHAEAADPEYASARTALDVITDHGAATSRILRVPAVGNIAPAAGKPVSIDLGVGGTFALRTEGDELVICRGTANPTDVYAEVHVDGGVAPDKVNSDRPTLRAPDFLLSGSNGKVVNYFMDLQAAGYNEVGFAWAKDASPFAYRWLATPASAGDLLYLTIPKPAYPGNIAGLGTGPGPANPRLIGVSLMINSAGGGAGEGVDVSIEQMQSHGTAEVLNLTTTASGAAAEDWEQEEALKFVPAGDLQAPDPSDADSVLLGNAAALAKTFRVKIRVNNTAVTGAEVHYAIAHWRIYELAS